jgi:hypothetical protein
MEKKPVNRVLIVGNGSLFDEGLKSLLLNRTRLEVSSTTYIDESVFLQQFLDERPEVIVLFEGSPLTVSRILELVRDIPDLAILRIITVLANTSAVELYERQPIAAARSDDLLMLFQPASV